MLQLTLEGAGLRSLEIDGLAASVRLLVPVPGTAELVMPSWNGNEFLLPDGERPALRTFTPMRHDPGAGRLDLQIVRHPGGAVSTWAESVAVGAEAAISGPGRGWHPDPGLERLLLFGDETALPAIAQILEATAGGPAVEAHVEVATSHAEIPLPAAAGQSVSWHLGDSATSGARLVEVASGIGSLPDAAHVWAAGEAASMQAIRKLFFEGLGVTRSQATIRGYWKPAR